MNIADFIDAMSAAGAPLEAIKIAVREISIRDDAEKTRKADRAAARSRERAATRERLSRDKDATVADMTRDVSQNVAATVATKAPPSLPPSAPPMIINSTPPLFPESPPAKTANRAKSRSSIGESAMPNARNIADAQAKGLDRAAITIQWPKFLDYHRSRGNLMADWDAAWRTWLGNVSQFQRSNTNGRSGSVSAAIQADIDRNGGDFIVPPKLGPLRPEDYLGKGEASVRLLSAGRSGRP